MTVWSYKVARDFGFAPNPFHGVCTLACCKPQIRRCAKVGDWVIGAGSKANGLLGKIVYAMIVDEKLTFDEYWQDSRFLSKKANIFGGHKGFFGDNIYKRDDETAEFIQANSHHSHADGTTNRINLIRDTFANQVLIAQKYVYFGADAVTPPSEIFAPFDEPFPHHARLFNSYSSAMQKAITDWLTSSFEWGLQGLPQAWHNAIKRK